MEDPVRLAVADRPQDDGLGLQTTGHSTTLSEVMGVTLYTTEPCGYCRVAKALLDKRNIPYDEVNLAKDPDGRADRKSTRLNSSHANIPYADFCLKKKLQSHQYRVCLILIDTNK